MGKWRPAGGSNPRTCAREGESVRVLSTVSNISRIPGKTDTLRLMKASRKPSEIASNDAHPALTVKVDIDPLVNVRVIGSVHYRFSTRVGMAMGHEIGRLVVARAMGN